MTLDELLDFDIADIDHSTTDPVVVCRTTLFDSEYGEQILTGQLDQKESNNCCQVSWIAQAYCNHEFTLMQVF